MERKGQGKAKQSNDDIILYRCESLIKVCESSVSGERMTRKRRHRDRLGEQGCFEGMSPRHQITKKFLLE